MKKLTVPFVQHLKVLSLVFIALAFLCSSCSKSGSDNEAYHLTCTIDGTPSSFNTGTFAHIEYASGKKLITINGVTGITAASASMGFIIMNLPSGDSITTGTYIDTTTRFDLLASYEPNMLNNDYEAGTSFYVEAKNAGVTLINHYTVVFTSITSTTIKGTFSGDFYYNGDAHAAKKTVTNGDFFVKIQ